MVSTLDGKTEVERGTPVVGLGSKMDQSVMHELEEHADAILVGAGTLRATPRFNWPSTAMRLVLSRYGQLDPGHDFFQRGPEGRTFALVREGQPTPQALPVLRTENKKIWLATLLRTLKNKFGVKSLLVEGGSEINAIFLAADVVDEVFLTLAPKIRLGRDLATVAGGDPLPGRMMNEFELQSLHQHESELFLRYRRRRGEE
ncbi:MAG: RibD family protein [Fimbriimonadaceae bacterium]|nr:RibD family protein [Fimbriimonadaceae bacterium]